MKDHNMNMEEKKKRMKELVDLLNRAGRAYYQEADEIMSNYEYDALYDELVSLEKDRDDACGEPYGPRGL